MPDDLRREAARSSKAASSDTPVAAQQTNKSKNQRPRLFLDLFAGVNAPLTKAMRAKGTDYFQPFGLDRDFKCNILDDSVFAILLRMAWSGLVSGPRRRARNTHVSSLGPEAPKHCALQNIWKVFTSNAELTKAKPFMTEDGRYCKLHLARSIQLPSRRQEPVWPHSVPA